MTDFQKAKQISQQICEMKINAIKNKTYHVQYEVYGQTRNEYYYSGRWSGTHPSKSKFAKFNNNGGL